MPWYCSEQSTSIRIALGTKKPSTYSSEFASGFFEPVPLICPHLLRLATKDYPDRLPALPTEILSGYFEGILNMFNLRGEGAHPLQQDDIESAQSIFDVVAGQVQSR
jgi:hypothetical protein